MNQIIQLSISLMSFYPFFYWAYYCNQYKTKHTQQNLSKTYILSSDYSCKTESNSRNGRKPGDTLANKSRKAGKYKAGAP